MPPPYPLVSIIIVVRNGAKFLKQTLESVLDQTYGEKELIVIDGASTDGTVDIIRQFEREIEYWQSARDKGIYDAMNKGLDRASGRYVLFLGAGDYLATPESLAEVMAQGLRDGSFPLLIAAQIRYAYKNELLDLRWPLDETTLLESGAAHQGLLVEQSVYKRIRYDTQFRIVGDLEFYAALREDGLFKPRFVATVLSVFRLGGISNQVKSEFLKRAEYGRHLFKRSRKLDIPRALRGIMSAGVKWLIALLLGPDLYYTKVYPRLLRLRWSSEGASRHLFRS